MIELLFLLLPLAAATGWFSGRRGRRSDAAPREHNPAYFKGLNLLLNEQPDKAIDVFVQMLEVDGDTVETHLALGNLFRRRGETERAIRIHQNLIARPTLNKQQRAQALLELGQDYLRAGLYDRAEGLFDELLTHKLFQVEALKNLHLIYQQEKEWERCLVAAGRLEALGEPSLRVQRAHYFCELAQQALDARNNSQAEALLKKAIAADKQNVRASILLGELARERGDFSAAFRIYSRIEIQDPDYLGEVIPQLIECGKQTGKRESLRRILEQGAAKHGNVEAAKTLADMVQEEQGEQAATELISAFLSRYPSLSGLEHLLTLRLRSAGGEPEPLLLSLRDLIAHMLDVSYGYRCGQCGFQARRLHWQCPSCKNWGSIKPYPVNDCYSRQGNNPLADKKSGGSK